jgi:hypothetical protein
MQIILFFSHCAFRLAAFIRAATSLLRTALVDFRLAELQSVAELFGIPIAYDKDADPSVRAPV